jgi:hypothetical protein
MIDIPKVPRVCQKDCLLIFIHVDIINMWLSDVVDIRKIQGKISKPHVMMRLILALMQASITSFTYSQSVSLFFLI